MGIRTIVSGGDEVRENVCGGRRIHLKGAGALAAAGNRVYVFSSWGNMIWGLDCRTLIPTGLFAGGPGVCQMMASRDHERLYALCEEADSLLMLSAKDGAPLLVNRAGVGPRAMAMDKAGEVIAVAGGASGEILLMDSRTLSISARLETDGMAFGVLLWKGRVYALSLDETLNSVCTVFSQGGKRNVCLLPGMPGTLCVLGGQVAVVTHEGLFFLSPEGACVTGGQPVPGRAGRMLEAPEGLLMTDMWSDTLFVLRANGCWNRVAENVRDAALITSSFSGEDES